LYLAAPTSTESRPFVPKATVVVVDDEPEALTLLQEGLRRRGYDALAASSADACLEIVHRRRVDVVITDVRMPDVSGIELCRHLHDSYPDLVTIVVTAHRDMATVVDAMRAGAYDFLFKPLLVDGVVIALARAIDHLALRREVTRLRLAARAVDDTGIVGSGPAMREMVELVARVAETDATVLVTGETGTGKERIARAIHERSPRRDQPFVAANCGAMPAPLLESELFGHVRGAFTDASRARPGLFVTAHEGTLLLDEIGEMPLEMQAKLLRVLQERTIRPVGGNDEQPVRVRVIATTNRDLEREVAEKRFREDLYYRINVVPIRVPPLRARTVDILELAQHFLTRAARRNAKPVIGIATAAARKLVEYDWPGNVRELENCMERAVALSRLDHITVEDLPAKILEHGRNAALLVAIQTPAELITLDEMERRYVRYVLGHQQGNKMRTARALGIDRRSLYRWLEREAARDSDS
jgi:DNA-binding NtrC family response regulator